MTYACDRHKPVLQLAPPPHFSRLVCETCLYYGSYAMLLQNMEGQPEMQRHMRRIHLGGGDDDAV